MQFLFPKQVAFFHHLTELAKCQKEIAMVLVELGNDFEEAKKYTERAKKIEHRADNKTREIIEWLNKTFVTPFDREDIYSLSHELDDIIDLIENVIHNIELYQITKKNPAIDEFIWIIERAAEYLEQLIEIFQDLKYSPQFKKVIIKIHDLENKGDTTFAHAMGKLFREEQNPIAIIKLKDIFENLEAVIDKYKKVSNIIEGIVIKSS